MSADLLSPGWVERTGLEMTRMLASGEDSAAALARSRTMEALVLNRSNNQYLNASCERGTYRHGSCRACEEHRQGSGQSRSP